MGERIIDRPVDREDEEQCLLHFLYSCPHDISESLIKLERFRKSDPFVMMSSFEMSGQLEESIVIYYNIVWLKCR